MPAALYQGGFDAAAGAGVGAGFYNTRFGDVDGETSTSGFAEEVKDSFQVRDGLIQIGGMRVASIVGVEGAVDVWVGGVDVVSGGSDDGIVQHLHDQNKEKRGEGGSPVSPLSRA